MEFTEFQREWREIAQRFRLTVRTPHQVWLGERTLELPVLLEGFGGTRGMLLVTKFDVITDVADHLVELGYGYSCLSDPTDRPSHPDEDNALVEMLQDWGWVGPGDPPDWYNDNLT